MPCYIIFMTLFITMINVVKYFQQPDLPKLPVPDLEKTLQRYLEAVQPILRPDQFERVQELAKQLAENEGPELQHHLAERQMKLKNWVREKESR